MIKKKNLTFQIHMPLEFLYSLFAVGTETHFYNMITELNLEPNDEIKQAVQDLRTDLSVYMENELNYFFDLSGFGYILYQYIMLHSDISDIADLIETIKKYDSMDFLFRIVKSVCKSKMPKEDSQEYEELRNNIDNMILLTTSTVFQDQVRLERVMESLKNPDETKIRFDALLTQFYKRCFKVVENDVKNILEEGLEDYQKLYQSNPESFIGQYLTIGDKLNPIIYLCFFKYISWHHYKHPSTYQNKDWFVLGIFSHLMFDEYLILEQYANLFKALSDPNRIAILKLLSARPWYGQELAEKLNITAATISYHMSFLQRIGIITYERMDNRSYYCLNNKKLNEPLEKFIDFLNVNQ